MVKTLQATACGVATVVKCQKFAAAAEAAAAATLSHRSACTRKVVKVEKKSSILGLLKNSKFTPACTESTYMLVYFFIFISEEEFP